MLWNLAFVVTTLLMLGSALASLFARQAMHGALNLVVSMIAVAVLYFLLGAPFISALQVSLYVGAIVVLLVFMITMLNRPGRHRSPRRGGVLVPLLLLFVLLGEGIVLFSLHVHVPTTGVIVSVSPKVVGSELFGHYLLLVEATALLLLAALTAVLHLSRKVEDS